MTLTELTRRILSSRDHSREEKAFLKRVIVASYCLGKDHVAADAEKAFGPFVSEQVRPKRLRSAWYEEA